MSEKKFLDALSAEEKEKYLKLKELLEKIAKSLGGKYKVTPISNEKSGILDYAIVKKPLRILLLRAYITYGYTPDAGGWSEATIAYRKIKREALMLLTKEALNVWRVNFESYNKERFNNFHL